MVQDGLILVSGSLWQLAGVTGVTRPFLSHHLAAKPWIVLMIAGQGSKRPSESHKVCGIKHSEWEFSYFCSMAFVTENCKAISNSRSE